MILCFFLLTEILLGLRLIFALFFVLAWFSECRVTLICWQDNPVRGKAHDR